MLTACASPETIPLDAGQDGTSSRSGATLLKSFAPGDRVDAPDFSGTTLTGDKVRLSDYRGEIVVVNAWASFCGPCRAESPALDRTQKKLRDQGVRVLGIDTDNDSGSGLAFQKEYGLSYPSLHDPGGKQFLELPAGLVNPQVLPFTLFVDREGRIARSIQAPVSEKALTQILTPLLKEAAKPAPTATPTATPTPAAKRK
ncbi:hypothetical protein SGFS_061480 [Streptomyces graminofaciens]|uniref:Thioredoxin domain-containing protein n=1 Tax=Streptomyces graminofaciens TaxID=68212 RepID=A0ABN5VNC1_9ACTN|nr:TlpA disulfide reductase family protein [Streptomyces graminofaciens]BBC34854.1 hypothetical protein SGFS_061480 [Streptomyces graminofaciens]